MIGPGIERGLLRRQTLESAMVAQSHALPPGFSAAEIAAIWSGARRGPRAGRQPSFLPSGFHTDANGHNSDEQFKLLPASSGDSIGLASALAVPPTAGCCNCQEVYEAALRKMLPYEGNCRGACTLESLEDRNGHCWITFTCPNRGNVGCRGQLYEHILAETCTGDSDEYDSCVRLDSCCDFEWPQRSDGMLGQPNLWDAMLDEADARLYLDRDPSCPKDTRSLVVKALSVLLNNLDLVDFAACRSGIPSIMVQCIRKYLEPGDSHLLLVHATDERKAWGIAWAEYVREERDRNGGYWAIPCTRTIPLGKRTKSIQALREALQEGGDPAELELSANCAVANVAALLLHEVAHACLGQHDELTPCDWVYGFEQQFQLAMRMRYPALRGCA